jgi:prepilin-type N-terminal cleavage/methylation domain-containing protein
MQKIKIKAFTLIELLVVIAIIGILSVLIIVGMSSATQKATIAKAQVFSNSLRNSLMDNIVSEWKFDNISGTIGSALPDTTSVSDSWGTNNGSTSGGPTLKDGNDCVSGKCLLFDGTDSVAVPNSITLGVFDANANSYSISVWAKSLNPSSHRILQKGSSSYPVSFQGGSASTAACVYDGTNVPCVDFGTIWNGNWRNLVFVVNYSTDKLYGYLDGVLLSPTTNTVTVTTASLSTLYIGNIGTGGNRTFNGTIDDVRIFNAAISASQIQQNYFAGLNKLFAKNQISELEYGQNVANLANSYAKN